MRAEGRPHTACNRGGMSGALRHQQGWAFDGGQGQLRRQLSYESQDEHFTKAPKSLTSFCFFILVGRAPTLVKSVSGLAPPTPLRC